MGGATVNRNNRPALGWEERGARQKDIREANQGKGQAGGPKKREKNFTQGKKGLWE